MNRWTPKTETGDTIPCFLHEYDLFAEIEKNDVTVISGETGSGKSTGVPHIILRNAKNKKYVRVLVTQPRRIAAVSLARRVTNNVLSDHELKHLNRQAEVTNMSKVDAAKPYEKKKPEKVLASSLVGFRVRFDSWCSKTTNIVYTTDGLLLKDIIRYFDKDATINKFPYDYVIIDEAHERSTRIDLLLMLIRLSMGRCCKLPFKLLIMSATVDVDLFIRYFSTAIRSDTRSLKVSSYEIEGRAFPITINYLAQPAKCLHTSTVVSAVKALLQIDSGDMLIFTSGIDSINILKGEFEKLIELFKSITSIVALIDKLERSLEGDKKAEFMNDEFSLTHKRLLAHELIQFTDDNFSDDMLRCVFSSRADYIRQFHEYFAELEDSEVDKLLISIKNCNLTIFRLHSTQSFEEQQELFVKPHEPNERRIIISTNVAETSVTVPNVSIVIDQGFVKCKYGNKLVEEAITKSMAKQRAGRAGRVCAGYVYRLYTELSYSRMKPDAVPEILRCSLLDVVIYLLSFNQQTSNKCLMSVMNSQSSDVMLLNLPFLQKIPSSSILDALRGLANLNLLSKCGNLLNTRGYLAAGLPLSPRYANMVLESLMSEVSILNEVIILASMLSLEYVWFNPCNNDKTAALRRQVCSNMSDHASFIYIFLAWKSSPRPSDLLALLHIDVSKLREADAVHGHVIRLIKKNELYNRYLPNKGSIPSVSVLFESREFTRDDFMISLKKVLLNSFGDQLGYIHREKSHECSAVKYVCPLYKQLLQTHPCSVLFLYKTELPDIILFSSIYETSEVCLAYELTCLTSDDLADNEKIKSSNHARSNNVTNEIFTAS